MAAAKAAGALLEYSVVYTDRALNHMSAQFVSVMQDLNNELKGVYKAKSTVIMPGSGTFAMEAVARQLVKDKKALVVRNGFFSYRWTDIFDQTSICADTNVLKATLTGNPERPHVTPLPLQEITTQIASYKPSVVFAPHVETSTGVMLPQEYISGIAAAAHDANALFVLDCIASGTVWVDMEKSGVDVVITAPQKGWSAPAGAGIAMLSERATQAVRSSTSDSMALNLRKWLEIMDAYEKGGFAYYSTMPTDALVAFRDAVFETRAYGYDKIQADFVKLGEAVQQMLESKGFTIVGAQGFRSPGVVVVYINDAAAAGAFKKAGLQVAGGVPFMLDSQPPTPTVRFGLFGLDKVGNIDRTVTVLAEAVDTVLAAAQ